MTRDGDNARREAQGRRRAEDAKPGLKSQQAVAQFIATHPGFPGDAMCRQVMFDIPQIVVDSLRRQGRDDDSIFPYCGALDIKYPGIKERLLALMELPAFKHRNMFDEYTAHRCGLRRGHTVTEYIERGVEAVASNMPAQSPTLLNFNNRWAMRDGKSLTQEAYESARAWGKGEGPPFLVLIGKPGCGKTHLLLGALAMARQAGHEVRFETVRGLLKALDGSDSGNDGGEAYYHAINAEYYGLDDLGVEKASEWTQSELGDIIDTRYREGMRTIITTNTANYERMSQVEGIRTADRLWEQSEKVKRVVMLNGSYRTERTI